MLQSTKECPCPIVNFKTETFACLFEICEDKFKISIMKSGTRKSNVPVRNLESWKDSHYLKKFQDYN